MVIASKFSIQPIVKGTRLPQEFELSAQMSTDRASCLNTTQVTVRRVDASVIVLGGQRAASLRRLLVGPSICKRPVSWLRAFG